MGNVVTVDSENPCREIKAADNNGVDLISCLPDEILHHILSFIETKFAIRTSVLSRRWRHICWNTPSLYFDLGTSRSSILKTELINKTLIRYKAAKFISIHIRSSRINNAAVVDSWIEFAMSRKVENLSLELRFDGSHKYNFPDIFYCNSSLKQLSLYLCYFNMIPRCTVSWTSLKNLSIDFCILPDESAAQILSGCPVLESLRLTSCQQLEFLDLSKLLLLKRLDISCANWNTRSTVIIAPHIRYLRLRNYNDRSSTLVDVSSLTEAHLSFMELSRRSLTPFVGFQNMLAKLHNVKKLSLEPNLLQILSYAEYHGATFPTLKVETMTLEINIFRSVLTGITKILQNSPELKKITVHIRKTNTWVNSSLFDHLDSEGLNEYQFWRVKNGIFQTPMDTIPMLIDMEAEAKFVLWVVECLLGYTKTVKTIVLLLGSQVSEIGFNELVRMVPTLHNKVSIVLKRSND